jgi:predicted dehydrogenase
MNSSPISSPASLPRRSFLSASAWTSAALSVAPFVVTSHAAPDDPIRIGLIGCGGRGTGAALDALGAATKVIYPKSGYHTEDVAANAQVTEKNVKIVALADVFKDRLEACRKNLKNLNMNIPDELCFTGFDAYQQLLAVSDINYVILGTPPHFHPIHLKAAVEAGKNVFMEKPGAVDAPGVRLVLEAGEIARKKGVGIVAGTQRRHSLAYRETVKRIRDGAIGEILSASCYWNGGTIWVVEPKPEWSELEWQLRNWNYFTWSGGDHIVEQHVHNLDIMNWVLGHPVKAYAIGGRQARIPKLQGNIYDHFTVEFEYANGLRMHSQCRQMEGCRDRVEERVVGTKGTSNCSHKIWFKDGTGWSFEGKDVNQYRQEHLDLINSIRAGKPLNEARDVAESTMLGILGREAAYSGQEVEWDTLMLSDRHLGPEKYELGPTPFPEVPVPGKHQAG